MALKTTINLKGTMFMVIDMQNDYCHLKGYCAKKRENISKLTKTAKNIISFVAKLGHKTSNIAFFKEEMTLKDYPHFRGSNKLHKNFPCKKGSWGAQLYQITPKAVYPKRSLDCLSNKKFKETLKRKRIKTVVLMGFQTPICVESTARRCFDKGYRVIVLKDLVAARKKWSRFEQKTLDFVESFLGETTTSAALLRSIK